MVVVPDRTKLTAPTGLTRFFPLIWKLRILVLQLNPNITAEEYFHMYVWTAHPPCPSPIPSEPSKFRPIHARLFSLLFSELHIWAFTILLILMVAAVHVNIKEGPHEEFRNRYRRYLQ